MALLGGALVAFYILLPLDRGFPAVPVLGRPLSAAACATLVVFALLVMLSGGRILVHLRRRYCVLQSVYFGVLIVASLRADAPLVSLHLSLVYYCTFVLNYVILLYVARRDGPGRLGNVIAVAGLAAAAVGVLQGVFAIHITAYEGWYASYFQTEAENASDAWFRAAGTLNNPILYGMAMMLLVPYALDVRRVWMRVAIMTALAVAAALTGSRTVLLVGLIFLAGAVRVYRWRVLWGVALFTVGMAVAVGLFGGLNAVTGDPRLRFLGARLGLVEGQSTVYAQVNTAYRREALRQGLREIMSDWSPVTWAMGRGQLTAASVGEKVAMRYNTVDNVFFGVFYEKGFVGLVLFLMAFGVLLRQTWCAERRTMHWYAPLALLVSGVAFSFDAYSTFNILAVGSMAIATVIAEGSRRSAARVLKRVAPDQK